MSFDSVLLLCRQYHSMAFVVDPQSGSSRNSSFQFQVDQIESLIFVHFVSVLIVLLA